MTCEEFTLALSTAAAWPPGPVAEHARSCEPCGRLWQTDRQLRSAPSALRAAPEQLPAELQRALATHRGATRAWNPWRRALLVFAISAGSIGLGLLCVPRSDLTRVMGAGYFWQPFIVCGFLFGAGLHLYLHRDRSGLNVSAAMHWAFMLFALLALEVSTVFQGHRMEGELPHGRGARDCLALGLLVAFAVGAVVLMARRRTALVAARSSGALAGFIAGLATMVFLHVHCTATWLPHLLIVHLLPLVLAVAIGALAGRRALAV